MSLLEKFSVARQLKTGLEQAGHDPTGVVFDSKPDAEYAETLHKSQALKEAVRLAASDARELGEDGLDHRHVIREIVDIVHGPIEQPVLLEEAILTGHGRRLPGHRPAAGGRRHGDRRRFHHHRGSPLRSDQR